MVKIDWGDWLDDKFKHTITYRVRFVASGRFMTWEDLDNGMTAEGYFVSGHSWIIEALERYQRLRWQAGLECERVVVEVVDGGQRMVGEVEVSW